MIECVGIRQEFAGRRVLHDVTFTVERGAVFGFIGPNGAGKTTTIRILATLLAPTEGVARVGGHDVVADPEAVRRIMGYMPDMAGVYEHITAAEYLDFFASAAAIPRDRRARTIENVVELTEIGQLRDREVSALSKGQKQRLLLARTLLHDPQVLILDEPASDLDPRARIELRMLLAELGRMGKTILLSSHILTELADVCSSIGVISHGRLVAAGPIDEVQATLRPGQRVRLKLLKGADAVTEALSKISFVQAVRRVDGVSEAEASELVQLEVSWEGDDWRLSEVVAATVAAGGALIGVEPERRDLERIFMDLTGTSVGGAAG